MAKSAVLPLRIEHRDSRREELLFAAARLFAERGFESTSMRDIAGEVGMLAGSMYHHFASKEELVAACHERGVAQIIAAVDRALEDVKEPWARLEAACVAHLEALLGDTVFAAVVLQDFSRVSAKLRRRLIEQRDRYERLFGGIVDDVPLARGRDRRLLRLMLLGALNWTPSWYRQDGATPREIAGSFVAMLRERA